MCYQTEPRHSAYSFFLPARILPKYTAFTSFTGLPPNSLAFLFPSRSFSFYLICFPIDLLHKSAMACTTACNSVVRSIQISFFFCCLIDDPSLLTINIHWDRRGKRLKPWQFVLWHPNGKTLLQAYRTHFLSLVARAAHNLLEVDIKWQIKKREYYYQ